MQRTWSRPIRTACIAATAMLAAIGCDSVEDGAPASGKLAIEVAPLSPEGITDAAYTLTVTNDADQVVWTRTITSSQYGDGAGAVSYVGSCDADSNPNTVSLVVAGLTDPKGALIEGLDWANPAPSGDPLTAEVTPRAVDVLRLDVADVVWMSIKATEVTVVSG